MRATSESVPWYPGSNPVAARRYTTTTASRNPNDAANAPLMTSCRAARGTPPRRQENHASGGTRRMRFTHQGSATSPVIMERFYRESRQISSRKRRPHGMSTGKRDSSARFAGFAMTGGSNLGGEKGAKKTCCSRNTPLQVKILAKLLSLGKVRRTHRGSLFPKFHDGGIVEIFLGRSLDVVVVFSSGGGSGKGDTELIAKVEREAEILVHEAQRKTRHVFTFEQVRRLDVEDAGAGHAGLHDLDELFALDASAGDEGQSLGQRVHLQREDQVHRQLDGLSGSMRTDVEQFFAHHAEDGFGIFERCCVASDHEDEFAFFRAPIAAGDRSIKEADPAFGARSGNFAGQRGRDGAGIHVGTAALKPLHGAAGSPQNFLESRRIADDREEKVAGSGDFLR